MRISDWSSDVCSSDLLPQDDAVRPHPKRVADKIARRHLARAFQIGGPGLQPHDMALAELQLGRALDEDEAVAVVVEGRQDRKRGVSGKRGDGRVDVGGGRNLNQTKTNRNPTKDKTLI